MKERQAGMNFTKMHGLGNDFIVVEAESFAGAMFFQPWAKSWCDRHFGIGADGILVTGPDETQDIFMRIFNADGSEAEMCGNGIRCVALYARQNGLTCADEFSVRTMAGPRQVQITASSPPRVRVDMGPPILDPTTYNNHLTIDAGEQCFHITAVSMGNPHAVIPVENVEQVPLEIWGPLLEKHPHFPAGTNVEFVQILGETEIKVRVWERGAGITLACGTGACAAMVACHLLGKTSRYGQVELPGGGLWIEWDPVDNHVYMTGSAREVFRGVIGEM
jgi:diaminopimelate epimerase